MVLFRSPCQLPTIRWSDVVVTFGFGLATHPRAGVSDLRPARRPASTRPPGRLRFGLFGEASPRASGARLDVLDADEDGPRLRHAKPGRRVRRESFDRVAP